MFRYINSLRMRRAAALIKAGNPYMRDVAAAVGISDQFYFARVFKKYYGIPPSECGRMTRRIHNE
jgi:two-component system response regulator YesN